MRTGDNVPFVVTILLAIAAWTFTHAVGRFLQQPILSFTQISTPTVDGRTYVELTFQNITQNVNFKGTEIRVLGSDQGDRFTVPKVWVVGVGWTPEANLSAEKDGIEIVFDDFHPGWKIKLETTKTGTGILRIQLKNAKEATILQESGFKTTIIEYEIITTTALGVTAFLVIIIWFVGSRWRRSKA